MTASMCLACERCQQCWQEAAALSDPCMTLPACGHDVTHVLQCSNVKLVIKLFDPIVLGYCVANDYI